MCGCEQFGNLKVIYEKLTAMCLCFNYQDEFAQQLSEIRLICPAGDCEHVLLHLSVFRLLFEVYKLAGDRVCYYIDKLVQRVKNEFGPKELFLLDENDRYVQYSARKTISTFISSVASDAEISIFVEAICKKILDSDISKVPVLLEILTDVLDNSLNDKHVYQVFSAHCKTVQLDGDNAKVACKTVIEVLGKGHWTKIVDKLKNACGEDCVKYLVVFCHKLVLAIKKYDNGDRLENFITPEVMSISQSGNAMTTVLITEADIVIEIFSVEMQGVSSWRNTLAAKWLSKIREQSFDRTNEILTRKVVLSVLLALNFRTECVRESVSISWFEELSEKNLTDSFLDQDDQLIQAMLAVLNLHLKNFTIALNPHPIFFYFLNSIAFDHRVLIDFLISSETSFLLFFTKYLKLVPCEWREFVHHASSLSSSQSEISLESVMTTLIQTRLAIERLHDKGLFPYNARPLIKLLEKCENVYEGVGDN